MMNDTTNHTTPIDDLHITMEEDTNTPTPPEAPPLPVHDYALMASLINTFTKHIERIVDQRFAALVESHQTMKLMDDNMQLAIANLIDDRIHEHESDHEHKNDDDIESEVSNHVEYFLRQGNHQFITERELSEKVSDVLDEILEERLNDALSNATVNISI